MYLYAKDGTFSLFNLLTFKPNFILKLMLPSLHFSMMQCTDVLVQSKKAPYIFQSLPIKIFKFYLLFIVKILKGLIKGREKVLIQIIPCWKVWEIVYLIFLIELVFINPQIFISKWSGILNFKKDERVYFLLLCRFFNYLVKKTQKMLKAKKFS